MEQDIKILEDFINKPVKSGEFNKISNKEIQAIENLLRRNCYLENEARKIINQELNKAQVDLYKNYIPISVIQNKIDELTKYRDLAKEQIEERVVIADSDSLNYGRAEAHDKDIQVLQKLLEERNK